MPNLFLVRHGETLWNYEGRFQGSTDVELNEAGLKQAADTAAYLSDIQFDKIYTSDLIRAKKTAEAIHSHSESKPPLLIDGRLKERGMGVFEGLTSAEAENGPYKDEFAAYRRDRILNPPPEGESIPVFFERIKSAFDEILEDALQQENTLVVAHAGTVRAFVCLILTGDHLPWPNILLRNCSITGIKLLSPSERKVIFLGDVSHLGDNLSL